MLILLLVFGAFVNAAGMLKSVATWEESLQARFNLHSLVPIDTILFVISLLVLPLILAVVCGALSCTLSGIGADWKGLTCRFAVALVPLGFSMWLAHLVFHLLNSGYALVPTVRRVAVDLSIRWLGKPDWSLLSAMPSFDWLPSLQLLVLGLGLLLTLYANWRIAQRCTSSGAGTFGLFMPWAGLAVSLYVAGVWIVFQPMQMRGMMH